MYHIDEQLLCAKDRKDFPMRTSKTNVSFRSENIPFEVNV